MEPLVQEGEDPVECGPPPGRNATVHRTVLTADLPPSIEWSLGDPAPAGCAIAGDRLSCLFGSLQAARQRTVHLRGRTGSGSCPGTAVVTAEAGAWPASVTATTQPLVRCPTDKTSAEPVDWTSTVLLALGAVLTGGLLLWGAWWWWGRRGRRLSHA